MNRVYIAAGMAALALIGVGVAAFLLLRNSMDSNNRSTSATTSNWMPGG